MKATHTDYKHPRHLRVEHNQKDGSGGVWCMPPSGSDYARLNKASLPSFAKPSRIGPAATMVDYKPV